MTRRLSALAAVAALFGAVHASSCGRPPPPTSYVFQTPEGAPLLPALDFDRPAVGAVARHRISGRFRWLGVFGAPEGPGLACDSWGADEDAFLWASGCRDLPLPAAPTGTPLRLAYGPRVRLRVVTDGEAPSAPYELQLRFLPRGPGDAPDATLRHVFPSAALEGWFPSTGWNPASSVSIAGPDPVTVRFSRPGPYRVAWTLVHVRRVGGGTTSVGIGVPDAGLTIEVRDGVEDQTIDLAIPGAALRDAGQSMGR